jgi:RluA family pseudouridine synthase
LRTARFAPKNRVMPSLPPVIFEDDTVVAFAKPSGLAIAPDGRDRDRASLLGVMRAKLGPGVANVHRIDDEASGLVLCAKTKPALDFLSGQFQAKTVEAVYLVLTVGAPVPDAGSLEFVLKEDEAAPGRMCVVKKHGQAALTAFTVLARFGRFALVECRPQTARRHQIRVHLAANGTPILHDLIYGDDTPLLLSSLKRGYKGRDDERPLLSRLALHAAELTFTHPVTRARMTLVAPLPKDFEVALKYLKKFPR